MSEFHTQKLKQRLQAQQHFPEVVLLKSTTTSTNDDLREIAQKMPRQRERGDGDRRHHARGEKRGRSAGLLRVLHLVVGCAGAAHSSSSST